MKLALGRDGGGRSRGREMREGGGAETGESRRGACERGRGLVPCRPLDLEVCLGSAYRANKMIFWIAGIRSIPLTKHANGQ